MHMKRIDINQNWGVTEHTKSKMATSYCCNITRHCKGIHNLFLSKIVILLYWQFFVKWHHNGCRYHIETFYEMSNCIYAPAMYCIGPSFGSHVGLYIFIHNPNLDWYKFTPYESMWLKSLMMEVCMKIPENEHIYSIDTFFISILKFVLFIML